MYEEGVNNCARGIPQDDGSLFDRGDEKAKLYPVSEGQKAARASLGRFP